MGRKPDPFIALHFVRGEKSGKNTNRYEQTCRHCQTRFPTGRQETLRAHLSRCLALTQSERAEAISQIYQTAPSSNELPANTATDQQQIIARVMALNSETNDSFSGLDLLAGAAQNATDMMIDPNLTGPESDNIPVTTAEELQYFGNHDMTAYHHGTPETSWEYPIIPGHDQPTTFDVFQNHSVTATESSDFSEVPASQVPRLSYAEVATVPLSFVPHPPSNGPFVEAEHASTQFVHESGQAGVAPPQQAPEIRTRKVKVPYSQTKKNQVSNMRKVGACVRCSRLRKNCDPNRPCAQCSNNRNSKTWIGQCTSLQRGQLFTLWYEGLAQSKSASQLAPYASSSTFEKYHGYLELAFFGENGPKMELNILHIRAIGSTVGVDPDRLTIDESFDVARKLLEHARDNLELIIEAINIPFVYATARVAAGLASHSNHSGSHPVWGSGAHGDENFARVFDIWLVTVLMEMEIFKLTLTVVGTDGARITDTPANNLFIIMRGQIDAALESVITKSEKDSVLHKFDAKILSQSYKHLFNLVIGIVLILNAIEKYCNFVERKPLLESDDDIGGMVEAAMEVVDPYKYCINNIKMMPKLVADAEGCLVAAADARDHRVDWSLQKAWIADMFLSDPDLVGCYTGQDLYGEEESWEGRLVSGLFLGLREA